MKELLLVRHAKSSWNTAAQKDFDRPLNDRGHGDAPMMAKRLLKAGISIDAFITSTAVRARTTAEYFREVYDAKKKSLVLQPDLYLAGVPVFKKIISSLPADLKTVAVFSHNPGITDFANELCQTHVDDMPTCSIFAVKAAINDWSDFEAAEKSFWFFDYPKRPV